MNYLSVKNWEEFQHYRDRNPPWIKLYNHLLENYEFCRLQDASKAHLVCIWMLASRTNNKINDDPVWIGQKIAATTKVNVDLLIDSGFLIRNQELNTNASNVLADCEQLARLEREQSRAEQRESIINDFDRWWETYPKKVKKKPAQDIWKRKKLDYCKTDLVQDVLNRSKNDKRWLDGYVPDPTTYLNQERWNDEIGKANGKTQQQSQLGKFERTKQKIRDWEAAQSGTIIDGELVGQND